ncbi:hypothetical protein LXL04_036040 [Taraxacum kok-saghyz]
MRSMAGPIGFIFSPIHVTITFASSFCPISMASAYAFSRSSTPDWDSSSITSSDDVMESMAKVFLDKDVYLIFLAFSDCGLVSRPGNPCLRVVYSCQKRIYMTRIWQTRTRHEF